MDGDRIDASVTCSACDAVCCRLTVLVMADDDVPRHLVDRDAHGMEVMGKDKDGWCIALDASAMRCGIYDRRPGVCRAFEMGGADCRAERAAYRQRHDRHIPLVVR
jgi:Fe-S-cluster containining protein